MPPGARIQHEGDNRVHPIPTRRAIAKALAFACAGAPFSALAQTVSEKQTRIIVPFPPGGGTDANARLIGSKLSDIFGMPVVLDNRTGRVARSASPPQPSCRRTAGTWCSGRPTTWPWRRS